MRHTNQAPTREHFVQLRVSRDMRRRVLLLAQEYDRTVSDILRGALGFGVPVMEGLRSIEREFVRDYLRQLKEEISRLKTQAEAEKKDGTEIAV